MRAITSILTSPRFVKGDIAQLKKLIRNHHILYIDLFGHLKPKFHMIVHYPRLLKENGPLVNLWTMRLESKHTELKAAANLSASSVNMNQTLFIKQRLMTCYDSFHNEKRKELELGPCIKERIYDYFKDLKDEKDLKTLKYVEIMGYKYETGTIIVRKITSKPFFGIIEKVFLVNNEVKFKIQKIKTYEFDKHYGAFHVNINVNDFIYLDYKNMPKFVPCLLVKTSESQFVVTRFWL